MACLSLDAATIGVSDVAALCQTAKRVGYDGVSLRYPHIEAYLSEGHSIRDLRRLLDDHELELSDVGFLAEWQYWGNDTPLVSCRSRAEARTDEPYASDRLHRFLSHCQELGARYVRAAATANRTGSLEVAAQDFARLCALAAPYNLNVGYEFFGTALCLSRMAEAAQMVRKAGAHNGGIILDTFLFYQGSSRVDEVYVPVELGVPVHAVHVADAAPGEPRRLDVLRGRLLPGTGTAPLGSILEATRKSGYDGWYVVEVFNPPMELPEALRTAQAARQATLKLLSGTS